MIDTQPGNSPGERGIVMKRTVYLTLMLIGLMAACILTGCKSGTKLENLVVDKENNIISCEYEGVKREIIVSLPETAKNAPLIVMLHGAGDSADNFLKSSEFDKEANEKGYAVCFISGSINSKAGRNSRSWNYGRIDTDYGKTQPVHRMVLYFRFDEHGHTRLKRLTGLGFEIGEQQLFITCPAHRPHLGGNPSFNFQLSTFN